MGSKVIKKDNIESELSLDTRLKLKEQQVKFTGDKKVYSAQELDAQSAAALIIQEAKEDALKIKKHAKKLYLQVEDKIAESKAIGYQEGLEEGKAALTTELVKIKEQHQKLISNIEREALSLMIELNQKIIGDALNTSDDVLLGMIRQVLTQAMGNDLVIFVHPSDLERIKTSHKKLLSCIQANQTLHLKPSENVQPGGCVIESELGSIEANFNKQIEAIKDALGISNQNK
ncbi:hypothetical protein BVY03_00940, partial [bacterium K02(2017)]